MESRTESTCANLVASVLLEASNDDFSIEDGLMTSSSSYYSSCLGSSFNSHTSEDTSSMSSYLPCRSYVDVDATSLNPEEHLFESSSSSSTSSTNTTIIHTDEADGPIWMRDMEETSSETSSTGTLDHFEEIDLNDIGSLTTDTDLNGCCFSRVKKKLCNLVQMISPMASNLVPEVLASENSKYASYDYVKLYEGLF